MKIYENRLLTYTRKKTIIQSNKKKGRQKAKGEKL